MKNYNELTGLYPLSKTLRFELKPIGKTLENIETKGLISQDETRAEEYLKVKEIIDRFHKQLITSSLSKLVLKLNSDGNYDSLEDYYKTAIISKRSESEEKEFTLIKRNLRKQIVDAFKKSESYGCLFKKELIQILLPDFVTDPEERKMVDNFSKFTTYFIGFHENRKNIYSDEEKSTSIAYRLIHENLPMFLDNAKSFDTISKSELADKFHEIESNLKNVLKGVRLFDVFTLGNFTNTLTQASIDVYNNIIGGFTLDEGVKIQGINEYVNLYNQNHKESKLPFLKPLYKMILSDRVALSWLPEEFKSDNDMITAIKETHQILKDALYGNRGDNLKNLLLNIKEFDSSRIYVSNDFGLTDISQQIFGQYDVFTKAIKQEISRIITPSAKERREPELLDKRINDIFKAAKSFSIDYLNSISGQDDCIQSYFTQLGAISRNGEQKINLFSQIEMARIDAEDALSGKYTNLIQSDTHIASIKKLLDSYKEIQHFIKPLLGNGDEADKDNIFDAKLRGIWDTLEIITPLYNKVRNWLTRKPYSTEKIKLNFENAQLLGGWDVNKEPDCTSVLLLKEGRYYLAILDKKANRCFDMEDLPSDGDCYDKVDYKLLPGANKMLPKVFFSKSRITEFAPSDKILDIYDKGSFKKGPTFNLADCRTLIQFFKDSIARHEDWKKFPFHFSDNETYEDISGFYREVEQQGYMISTRKISCSYIDSLVNNGKIYLFQIWNKDFSEFSKGTPNMHTLYWKTLFDKQNLSNVIYKLNGQAEVFYRKRSLDINKTTIHQANHPIKNKNKQNTKSDSTFDYDIIKNRRYTVDKFEFHVPITMNFKSTGTDNINSNIREIIQNGGIKHIIGIDRGERHLLYLSLIDLKGNIVKQMSLNEIINEYNHITHSTNYKDLLAQREGDRNEARRNWNTIESISELKEGYLSQVVHIISKMMIEYKAIVVLEDLNTGFMRGRQKIERNVYEQFEKKLIDKLNYVVDKNKDADEIGGILRAYQLANKFDSFKTLGKQSGCIFYVPAWNTSKIDPVTGFVNLFESSDLHYESMDKTKCFFSKFNSILYNEEHDWFEFSFDFNNFGKKAEGTRSHWTACSYGTRIRTFRNPEKLSQWDNEEVILTDEFKKIFKNTGIDISGNIKDGICMLDDKKSLEELLCLFKLMLQLRNSITNSEEDFILSPIANESGNFYDSRAIKGNLPENADANGAYNIARKGLWVIRQIKTSSDGKPNLSLSNKEWLKFAQEKPYLND